MANYIYKVYTIKTEASSQLISKKNYENTVNITCWSEYLQGFTSLDQPYFATVDYSSKVTIGPNGTGTRGYIFHDNGNLDLYDIITMGLGPPIGLYMYELRYSNMPYESVSVSTYMATKTSTRGSYVKEVSLPDGSRPNDGEYSDGYWYVRDRLDFSPPSIPTNIRIKESPIYHGDTITVQWNAAIDPEGGPVTYSVKRSVDGKTSTEIGSTSNLYIKDTIGVGWTNIKYSVYATDRDQFTSIGDSTTFYISKRSMYYNDKGTIKNVISCYYNDNGTIKKVEINYNDNSTIKKLT